MTSVKNFALADWRSFSCLTFRAEETVAQRGLVTCSRLGCAGRPALQSGAARFSPHQQVILCLKWFVLPQEWIKSYIKFLGDDFGDKVWPNELTNDFENLFKLVSFFIRERMRHLLNFYSSFFLTIRIFSWLKHCDITCLRWA